MLNSSGEDFKTESRNASLRPSFAYGVTRADGFFIESRTPLGMFPRLLTAAATKLGDAREAKTSE